MFLFGRKLVPVFLLICCAMPAAVADHMVTHHDIGHEEKLEILKQRFRLYNKTYPEIQFIHIDGGDDWRDDLATLLSLLGEKATSMDYEHPPELARDLMDANIARLEQMIKHDIVSAALFSLSEESISERPYMCVVTLNPEAYIGDSVDALRYMLDLEPGLLSKVHPTRYLDTYEHLRFTIDHEVFHCLDSYLYGGAPMTRQKLGGEYNLFRRESAADVYALGFQMRNAGTLSDYARNITHVRSMWLFTESPNRCTYDSMLKMYNSDPVKLSKLSLTDLVRKSVKIVENTIGDYEFYVRQRATAFKAAKKLGHAPNLYGDAWLDIEDVETDPKQVEYKIKRYRYYFSQLFTDKAIKFTTADIPGSTMH